MDQIARTPKQLGAIVRRVRKQQCLTQEDLGSKIQLRQATISKLEAGEPATRIKTLLDALSALDLEIIVRPRTRISLEEIEDIF